MTAAGKNGFKAVELPVAWRPTSRPGAQLPVAECRRNSNRCERWPSGKPDQAVMYTAHYDHLGFVPDGGRQRLQRRRGQCHRLRHGAGDGACMGAVGIKPPHSVILRVGYGGGTGAARVGVSGQASADSGSQIALDINYDMILPIGVPLEVNVNGAQRTTFYPEVECDGEALRSGDCARSASRGGKLLPQRSFLALARGNSGVLNG